MSPSRTLPRQLVLLALAGVAGALPAGAVASSTDAGKAKPAAQAESAPRITLDFVEAELTDVAKALSVQSGVNIAVTSQAKGKVTMRLRNTTLEEALRFVSRLAGVDYRRFESTFVIGTAEELRQMSARAGVSETWSPKHIKSDAAQTLVQGALPFVTVQALPNSSNVLLLGSTEDVASARRLLADADQPDAAGPPQAVVAKDRVTRIFSLKYLHPSTAKQSLVGDGKGEEGKGGMFPDLLVTVGPEPFAPTPANFTPLSIEAKGVYGGQQVTSNKDANGMGSSNGQTKSHTLILVGPADQVSGAIDLLQALDKPAPQVMIEAKMVDISPEKASELGLQYDWTSVTYKEGPLRNVPADSSQDGTVDAGGSSMKFGRFFRTPFDLNVTLKALETQRFAKLLANPKISVVDSEDASIFIGDLLRYRVLQSVTATGSQFTVETVPVGVALLVRPRIHDDGYITMKIHPAVSTVTAFIGPENIPQTASREADSTIRMKDGETIVIGGLLREEELKILRSVPIISKLPLIGELFKSRNTTKRKSEVTVFLTAKIIK